MTFDRLSTIVHYEISHLSEEEPIYAPVYLFLTSPEDASIFLNLGFLDDDHRWLPARTVIGHFDIIQRFMYYVSPQYVIWLHKYLPRFWEWVSQDSKLKRFDFILADVTGRNACRSYPPNFTKDWVTKFEILNSTVTDNCGCLCAPTGCNPLDVLAGWLASTWWNDTLPGRHIRPFLENHGHVLNQIQLTCLIRRVTFEALDMTHTCLHRYDPYAYSRPWGANESVREDIEASRDDYEKLVYLDSLVAEFEDFMLSRSESLEPKPTGGSTISTAQSDDEDAGSRALVFWNEIWPHRVEEIKKKLEATWDPDLEILDDLNVSLWFEEDEGDVESETLEECHARCLDDFMARLDKI